MFLHLNQISAWKKHGNPPIHRFLHLSLGGYYMFPTPGMPPARILPGSEEPGRGCLKTWTSESLAMQQEPIHWRYLPLIKGLFFRPKFQGISLENMP